MASKSDCCLCAPQIEGKARGDRLCAECISKAMAYDSLYVSDIACEVDRLKDRLRTAMRVMKRSQTVCLTAKATTLRPLERELQDMMADILGIMIKNLFAPELVEDALRERLTVEFQRQAEVATIGKAGTR